jgi:hypothetical protein
VKTAGPAAQATASDDWLQKDRIAMFQDSGLEQAPSQVFPAFVDDSFTIITISSCYSVKACFP